MKHHLVYHLVTFFGLFISSSSVKSQTGSGVTECKTLKGPIYKICEAELEIKYRHAEQNDKTSCMFLVDLYICQAARLCEDCSEVAAKETSARDCKSAKDHLAEKGTTVCPDYIPPISLDVFDCMKIKNAYHSSKEPDWLILGASIGGGLFLLITILGLVYCFACKKKKKKRGYSMSGEDNASPGRGRGQSPLGRDRRRRGNTSTAGKTSTFGWSGAVTTARTPTRYR